MKAAAVARRLARRTLPPRVRRTLARRLGAAQRDAKQGASPAAKRRPERGASPAAKRRPERGASPAPSPAASEPDASLLDALERGVPLERAVVAQVRSLAAAGRHDRAESLAEGLAARPQTATLGRLAGAIVAHKRGYRALAWERFQHVPAELWATLAPAEYARSGLSVEPDAALREVRDLVAADPDEVRARSWYEILAAVWGYGASDLARDVFAIFDRHAEEDAPAWRDAAMHRDWMRAWVAADPDSPSAPPAPAGRRTFAVMDYGHPSASKASANLGDHIQSIAALGHLVRHRNLRLHGRAELVDLLTELAERTRPERRRHDVDADLEVITVHRDASMYEPIPPDTWVLGFGWFMHALFRMRHGFPLHRNLRPIFVSFHCNKRDLLTPEAIAYLRRYGPVGCRDWTTVYLLLSLDVPAFFSGCLTTTIDTVFPALETPPPAGAPVAHVDVPGDGAPTFKHSRAEVRRRPFVANVRTALALLETYRREHSAVVTSRLHCYLPVRSLGMPVEFTPKRPADIRFDGLAGIDDAAFAAIRDGLLAKLEPVLAAIASGRPETEVYAIWRALTADDVAAAEARRSAPETLPPVAPRKAQRVRAAAARATRHGEPAEDAVHCAVVAGPRGGRNLGVLAASLLEHATRPLHLWVLARPGAEGVEHRLTGLLPFTWLPVGGLRPSRRLRLLLPELLTSAERAILLPLPAVATADVAELAELDLGGHALAAARDPGVPVASGFGVIHAAAERLVHDTAAAAELRRTAHARHTFDFDAFGIDVLVLDLARMRRDGFTERAFGLARAFGLDDREVLHHTYGPGRAALPARWAQVPTRMPPAGPGLVHWADRVKPWQRPLTPQRDLWRAAADAAARTPASRAR